MPLIRKWTLAQRAGPPITGVTVVTGGHPAPLYESNIVNDLSLSLSLSFADGHARARGGEGSFLQIELPPIIMEYFLIISLCVCVCVCVRGERER